MIKRLPLIILNILASLFITLAWPLGALADGADTQPSGSAGSGTDSQTTPPATTNDAGQTTTNQQTGAGSDSSSGQSSPTTSATTADTASTPDKPSGPDANTYTYNSSTGLWENAYYTWNPVTHQTTPKQPLTYSYNPATGRWDTTEWVYDATQGKYVPNVVSVSVNPDPAITPTASPTTATTGSDGSGIAKSGSGSNNNVDNSDTNDGFFDGYYDASISNTVQSQATSGSALVAANTNAGSALTGNATDVTNIINVLASQWDLQGAGSLATFTKNINGDVTGDFTIDIADTGPDSSSVTTNQTNNNLTINNQGSGLIDNKINVGATSGNATVTANTHAGSATTGNATAVADVVNVINTAISAGQSFLGVININGNLNGDILLPPNFVDQLIKSGAPSSTVTINQTQTNNIVVDNTNTQTINNNVNLSAQTGGATVTDNTNAGSATSGNAATKLTVFNLTGSQVVGANSLLVFVNVQGQWVGLIMDAPAGSTTAALCGGNCQASTTTDNNINLTSDTHNTINNDITVAAQSGDATVANNTNAGSATSGNASASANLLNISGSNMSLSDWFGILFINVLGTWHGSFGINTDAGNIIAPPSLGAGFHAPFTSGGTGGGSNSDGNGQPAKVFVFGFVPGQSGNSDQSLNYPIKLTGASLGGGQSIDSKKNQPFVLGAGSSGGNGPSESLSRGSSVGAGANWIMPVIALGGFATALGAGYIPSLSERFGDAWLSYRLRQR